MLFTYKSDDDFKGVMMKYIGFFVLILALLAVSGCMEGSDKGGSNKTTDTSVSEPQTNQDGEWMALAYVSGSFLHSDMMAVSTAAKSLDMASLRDASNMLSNRATKALELSEGYKVSPKYNSLKDNYESSLKDYRNAAIHMGKGIDSAYTNTEKAKEEMNLAINYINSGTNYMNQFNAELDKIYRPIRKVTFDIGEGVYVIDSTGTSLGKTKSSYGTEMDSSNPGYLIQKTNGEFKDKDGSDAGFIRINVTTFREGINSTNEEKLLNNAIDFAVDSRNKNSISEKGVYKASLSTSKVITVHTLYSPMAGFYQSSADAFSFMPDNHTIVTVLSSTDGGKTAKMIKTLKIDNPPSFG